MMKKLFGLLAVVLLFPMFAWAGTWLQTDGLNRYYRLDRGDKGPAMWNNYSASTDNLFDKLWKYNEINIRSDYAATGDGVTDDSSKFSSAQAALSVGGQILIPIATYYLASGWTISNSDIIIEGQGYDSVLRAPSSGSTALISVTGSNVTFRNLRLIPNGTWSGTLISLSGATGVRFENVWFDGSSATTDYGYSISAASTSDDLEVIDCKFLLANGATNRGWTAVYGIDSADGRVEGCRVDGGRAYGIDVRSTTGASTGWRIVSNRITDTASVGILTWNSYTTITGNTLQSNGNNSIMVTGDPASGSSNYGTILNGNTIENPVQTGITFEYDVHEAAITGCTIKNSTNQGGISFLRDVTDVTISGNTVSDCDASGRAGIQILNYGASPCSRIIIDGNTCYNNDFGILVEDQATFVKLGTNDCYGNATANVYCAGMQANREIVTAASATLLLDWATEFDTTSNAIAATLPDGQHVGQQKLMALKTRPGTNNAVVTVTHHSVSDGYTYTFDAVDEAVLLQWSGTEWFEIANEGFGGAGGEANTASNYGVGGIGLWYDKSGVDLRFKNINSGTDNRLSVTNDPTNREVDIDINFPQSKLDATVAPGVNDDNTAGYEVGSQWCDVTADKEYVCLDASTGAAVWVETTAGAAGGEANTASNYGVGGVGLWYDKNGVDLRFKNINAGSAKITVTNDGTNREVDIDASDVRADADGAFETIVLTAEGAVIGSSLAQQVVGGSGYIKQYELEYENADTGNDAEAFWTFVIPDNYSATFNSGNSKVIIWYYNEGATPVQVTWAIGWRNWTDDSYNPASTDVVNWTTTINDTAGTQNLVQKVAEANFDPDWVAGDMVTFGLKRTADTEDDTVNFLRLKIEIPVDHVFTGG